MQGSAGRSELVEGEDVDGLDIILEGLDELGDGVGGDLVVLDGGADDDLEDAVGDGLLLPLGLPHEAVHLDAEDLVGEGLEIGLFAPRLDLPNDEGLGNRSGLLLLSVGLLTLLLEGGSGLSGSIIVATVAEEVVLIDVVLSRSSGLRSRLGSGLRLLLALFAALLATILLLLAALGSAASWGVLAGEKWS